jgi:lipopolysaccharide transport system ATP-binding protein
MIANNTAISVNKISKKYQIGKVKDGSLREVLSNIISNSKNNFEEFYALKDVSFQITKGDIVGIIGKNGAGKSTLLKILSQITKPTKGRIEINGRIASLLEVGTGFHPELTGRENIYLNGTILGMSRKEVKSKFDEIVEFSGIEKFIDTPVKHYSSGMYVRLAFAVAAHLEPEILIIDEVLAVGDAEFQKKCLGKMQDVANQGRTVLFVSHHLGSIRQLCNKGILIEHGEVKKTGNIEDVIQDYQKTEEKNNKFINHKKNDFISVFEAEILNSSVDIYHNENISIKFTLGNPNNNNKTNANLLLRVLDEFNNVLFSSETKINNRTELFTEIPSFFLVKGTYKLNSIIYEPGIAQYENISDLLSFEILDNKPEFSHLETFEIGNVYCDIKWN